MPTPVSLDEMIYETARELDMLKRIYSEYVLRGLMPKHRADRRIEVFQTILNRLQKEREGTGDELGRTTTR